MRSLPQQIFKPRHLPPPENSHPNRSILKRWLLGLNLLSLDAPIVALVWQDFFAVNFGLKLLPAYRVLLALCAWLAYAADRWMDGWKIPFGQAQTPRHLFAQQHRKSLGLLWLMVLGMAGVIASRWLTAALFFKGIALLIFVGIYFLVNQLRKTTGWLRGLKEISIAAIFAAASVGWILPRHWLFSLTTLWAVTGWAALCFLNCFAIAGWELNQDRTHHQESLVTRWPFLAQHFPTAVGLLIGYAMIPALVAPAAIPLPIALALAGSAAILAALNVTSGRQTIKSELLPILADIALLTPLCFKLLG